jgi:mono/diheme cytochrome c family protein
LEARSILVIRRQSDTGVVLPSAALFLACVALLSWTTFAQDLPPIWTGIYTPAQAERGHAVMQQHCGDCHGEDFGGREAPALTGSTFMIKWEMHTVERLFQKIRDTMPGRGRTDVSEKEKVDAVAYILQMNGFPAGSTELSDAAPGFASIRIVPKGVPSAPRSGALVQMVGCLQQNGANGWMLSDGTDPQVTTLDPVTEADRTSFSAGASGGQTIELLNVFPSPAAFLQNRVLVKGLFIKTASATRINVVLIESLAPSC